MSKTFKPKILFHEPKSGSTSSFTIDDKSLHDMTETSEVHLKFDYSASEDVDSNGNVTFIDRDIVLQDISELINVDIYFKRPVIIGPQYNFTVYGGTFQASPFEAVQIGCVHIKTIWEFSPDGKFLSSNTEKVEITQTPLDKYSKIFNEEVYNMYVRCTYVGRSTSGTEVSLTSNIRVFSARNQVETDYINFVETINRANITRGICTLAKMAVNMGMIQNEDEFQEVHRRRFMNILEKYHTSTFTLNRSQFSETGSSPWTTGVIAFDAYIENNVNLFRPLANQRCYHNAHHLSILGDNEREKYSCYVYSGDRERIENQNTFLPFQCYVIDYKNPIIDSSSPSGPIGSGVFWIYINKEHSSDSDNGTFFSIAHPGYHNYAFSVRNSSTALSSATVNIDWYRLKPVQGSNETVHFEDVGGGVLSEYSFMEKSEFAFKAVTTGENIRDVEITPNSEKFNITIEETSVYAGSEKSFRFRCDVKSDNDGYLNQTEQVLMVVKLIMNNDEEKIFNYRYSVGFPISLTDAGVVLSYTSNGVKRYKFFKKDDSSKYLGSAWCPLLNTDIKIEGIVGVAYSNLQSTSSSSRYKSSGVIFTVKQIERSSDLVTDVNGLYGVPVESLSDQALKSAISTPHAKSIFFNINVGNNDSTTGFGIIKPIENSAGGFYRETNQYFLGDIDINGTDTNDGLASIPDFSVKLRLKLEPELWLKRIIVKPRDGSEVIHYDYDVVDRILEVNDLVDFEGGKAIVTKFPDRAAQKDHAIRFNYVLMNKCPDCGTEHIIKPKYGCFLVDGVNGMQLVLRRKYGHGGLANGYAVDRYSHINGYGNNVSIGLPQAPDGFGSDFSEAYIVRGYSDNKIQYISEPLYNICVRAIIGLTNSQDIHINPGNGVRLVLNDKRDFDNYDKLSNNFLNNVYNKTFIDNIYCRVVVNGVNIGKGLQWLGLVKRPTDPNFELNYVITENFTGEFTSNDVSSNYNGWVDFRNRYSIPSAPGGFACNIDDFCFKILKDPRNNLYIRTSAGYIKNAIVNYHTSPFLSWNGVVSRSISGTTTYEIYVKATNSDQRNVQYKVVIGGTEYLSQADVCSSSILVVSGTNLTSYDPNYVPYAYGWVKFTTNNSSGTITSNDLRVMSNMAPSFTPIYNSSEWFLIEHGTIDCLRRRSLSQYTINNSDLYFKIFDVDVGMNNNSFNTNVRSDADTKVQPRRYPEMCSTKSHDFDEDNSGDLCGPGRAGCFLY